MLSCSNPPPAVPFSLQPPCVFHSAVRPSVAEQGDDVAVLNGCQEEYKPGSAKVQHTRMSSDSISALVKHPIKQTVVPFTTFVSSSVSPRSQPPGSQRSTEPPTGGASAGQPELSM